MILYTKHYIIQWIIHYYNVYNIVYTSQHYTISKTLLDGLYLKLFFVSTKSHHHRIGWNYMDQSDWGVIVPFDFWVKI